MGKLGCEKYFSQGHILNVGGDVPYTTLVGGNVQYNPDKDFSDDSCKHPILVNISKDRYPQLNMEDACIFAM